MTEHTVVIAGGGPTGLMLAGELALAEVDVAIVERRPSQDLPGSRAGGLHARTIEVLDQRGVADRFLSQGKVMQVAGFAMIPLDISDFPTRHNYGLALFQERIERILAAWVEELSVPIYRGREVTGFALDELREALIAVYGTDYGVHNVTFLSRFTDTTRQAASYRERRVILAGDAAHVHFPAGGQGLNIGVQDAVNLGWKLAQVVNGSSPVNLLDTYHAERHPVAARVLRNMMAQRALGADDERTVALRGILAEVLTMDQPRKHIAAMISGLDVAYDLGGGHPLLGRRMPDLDLVTADGPIRVFSLLHSAKPVLLNFGQAGGFDIAPWVERVQLVDATYAGSWELPVVGEVTAPSALLVRPDGHVAWVGDGTDAGLRDALTTWFGP